MTTTSKVLLQSKPLEDAQTTQYVSSGCKTVIDLPTLTNTDALPQAADLHLVPVGGTAGADNLVHKALTVAAGATVIVEGLAGARLDSGDFVSTIAVTDVVLNLRLSGRQITT